MFSILKHRHETDVRENVIKVIQKKKQQQQRPDILNKQVFTSIRNNCGYFRIKEITG